jgi:hypothetical protein
MRPGPGQAYLFAVNSSNGGGAAWVGNPGAGYFHDHGSSALFAGVICGQLEDDKIWLTKAWPDGFGK